MQGLIAGAGIVGLTTALTLHKAGLKVRILEEALEIKELGVGLNLLPHSVKHLIDLGLGPALDSVAVRTGELRFFSEDGKAIWQEPRGLDAGYDVPQYSIHRGKLQALLKQAVVERMGAQSLVTDRRLLGFTEQGDSVNAEFSDHSGVVHKVSGDYLIGADGINSVVRQQLHPDQGSPHFAGLILWRGATFSHSFLTAKTMIMAGHADQKVVVYPISSPDSEGQQLINWVAEFRVPLETAHVDDWKGEGQLEEFAARFDSWQFSWLNVPVLFRQASRIYKFPMIDRDPLDRWSFGRVTLAGDAAHAMFPNGSNGASQGILDAVCIAEQLSSQREVVPAFKAFEEIRRPATTRLILDNRNTGPERVLQLIKDRCPGTCGSEHTCVPAGELEDIARAYKKLAGFARSDVNEKTSG